VVNTGRRRFLGCLHLDPTRARIGVIGLRHGPVQALAVIRGQPVQRLSIGGERFQQFRGGAHTL
jgi:hypothetical protein